MAKESLSKPIEDYGLIGDGHTVALVARDGGIDWLCWPRFDSDACLSALLGTGEHGTWRIAPFSPMTATRRYAGDDLVLRTEFASDKGRLVLTDFMPIRRDGVSAIVRRLEAFEGTLEVDVLLRLRFGHGEMPPWWEQKEDGIVSEIGPNTMMLRGPSLSLDGEMVRARLTLRPGERADFVLRHGCWGAGVPKPLDPAKAQEETERWWRGWIAGFDKPTDWPEAVKRSLLTLKALTYFPSGGIVAAPTLGLPEKPRGSMNWDYRYCWLRDSTFTLTAVLNAGFHKEAEAWRDWLFRAVAGDPDKMRIMYRVDGGRRIDETEIPFLPGWNGARPVQIGNAAAGQKQLDVYGEWKPVPGPYGANGRFDARHVGEAGRCSPIGTVPFSSGPGRGGHRFTASACQEVRYLRVVKEIDADAARLSFKVEMSAVLEVLIARSRMTGRSHRSLSTDMRSPRRGVA